MPVRKFASTITILIALMLLSTPCASSQGLPSITVGHVGHDHQIALYVAAEAGRSLEKQYGVYLKKLKDQEAYVLYDNGKPVANVRMVRVGGGSKMPAALEQGHIEVGLGGLGPVAKFIDKGSPLKVLAPLNNDGDALVLGKTMRAGDWAGFIKEIKQSDRAIRIGYKAPMAVAYMIFTRALSEEGITFGNEPLTANGTPVKVLTINLQGLTNALPSLESGIVDGVVVNEPMASLLAHKGVGRIAADLSTLPPQGKWEGHPCCIVAARSDALEHKREIIKSLLKAIAAGGDLIARDKKLALEAEAKWTRTPVEVGEKSMDNVDYVTVPDARWIRGVDTWIGLMDSAGHFKKALKGIPAQQVRELILDLGPVHEALKEITLKSGSK